jgi:hypothetical protein
VTVVVVGASVVVGVVVAVVVSVVGATVVVEGLSKVPVPAQPASKRARANARMYGDFFTFSVVI